MQTMKLGQRVVSVANRLFHGEVIEVGDDGSHGYVRFDGEGEEARTFFSAGELDDEPKPEAKAEPKPEPKKK